jgi:hypothetical protein
MRADAVVHIARKITIHELIATDVVTGKTLF